jgi:hypothetical protein
MRDRHSRATTLLSRQRDSRAEKSDFVAERAQAVDSSGVRDLNGARIAMPLRRIGSFMNNGAGLDHAIAHRRGRLLSGVDGGEVHGGSAVRKWGACLYYWGLD